MLLSSRGLVLCTGAMQTTFFQASGHPCCILCKPWPQNFRVLRHPSAVVLQSHVVAEISDLDNEPLVKMIGGAVHTIVSHDVIGRLMIQVKILPCHPTPPPWYTPSFPMTSLAAS